MKKILVLLISFLFLFTLAACNSEDDIYDSGKEDVKNEDSVLLKFTLEELSMYDGKDGNLAYITVSGIVYDVTDEWNNGEHNGVMAGTDASEQIINAPHGISILEDLEIIGSLVDSEEDVVIEDPVLLVFTLEELATYDGINGNMSYIAVEGIVYEVSSLWKDGVHDGVYAGTDASVAFAGSAHLRGLISSFTVVGELSE